MKAEQPECEVCGCPTYGSKRCGACVGIEFSQVSAAYDYQRQCWVEGEAALVLRAEQLREEHELLTGAKGPAYAAFLGYGNHAEALAACDAALVEAQARLLASWMKVN